MKKRSLTKNYIYNLSYQIIILILPLLTAPYISRVLGAENIGIYSYTISITTYFVTFGALGIALYGQREIAYLQNDKKEYSKTFYEIILLRAIAMFISLTIFYFVFVFKQNEYQIYYRILLLEIIGNLFDISWFFQGLEEFKKTVMRNTIVKILSLISIFSFVKTRDDLYIYFIIYVLSIFIGNISLWFYLPKYVKKTKIKELNVFRHFKPTIALFIPQIAIQVYTLLDKTMIGTIIADKAEVGYYDQSQKIIKVVLTVVTSLGTVMMPRIANTYAEGNKKKIEEYMSKSFNMVFFLAFPIVFGIIIISDVFVPIFFGDGYIPVINLMKVISPIILLIGLSNVTGTQYLLPTKRQKEFTLSVVFGACVNFSLNMFLIPRYGALGASVGTVLAELTVSCIQAYFVKDDFNIKNIIRLSWKYVFSSLIMFAICSVCGVFIHSNWISAIIQIVIGGLTYITVLLILKDSFLMDIVNKLLIKFNIRRTR